MIHLVKALADREQIKREPEWTVFTNKEDKTAVPTVLDFQAFVERLSFSIT